ncbi:MAG: hypothetical protein IH831_03705 [Planctomycetes bacterium]|nr:hypothetical protein [Planctomycetota bacterium]
MGGELKQYQVLTSPQRLSQYGVTIDELTKAVEKSNSVSGGGFVRNFANLGHAVDTVLVTAARLLGRPNDMIISRI